MAKLNWFCLLLLLSGCSVSVGTVHNRPPKIDGFVRPLDLEYGRVEFGEMAAGITLFFWRNGTEQAIERQTRAVSGSSNRLDLYTEERARLAAQADRLKSEFSADCDGFVLRRSRKDPDLILAWKAAPTDADGARVFASCQSKQSDLLAIKDHITKDEGLAAQALEEFLANVPSEDMRTIDKEGSSLIIHSGGAVDLTLKDFAFSGLTYSTGGMNDATDDARRIRKAAYDPNRRLLRFEFDEIDADGKQTGLVYKFLLERANDFMGLARFKGDMKLVDQNGVSKREGSAQFQGRMSSLQ